MLVSNRHSVQSALIDTFFGGSGIVFEIFYRCFKEMIRRDHDVEWYKYQFASNSFLFHKLCAK